jgi:hypothetical protein
MANKSLSMKIGINECSSCRGWKVDYSKTKSQSLDISLSIGKKGFCIGGGIDGLQTQSDEVCSKWKPHLDKERILPIFFDKSSSD